MMAQYSRQVNLETETTEERTVSPTCEVLSEDARLELHKRSLESVNDSLKNI